MIEILSYVALILFFGCLLYGFAEVTYEGIKESIKEYKINKRIKNFGKDNEKLFKN